MFDPEAPEPVTDKLWMPQRMLAHKAIVLEVPTDTQPDLRERLELAISLSESNASAWVPLADVYIFAAEAFPQERSYAEKAVREIEKLLDPSVPDAEKDPRAIPLNEYYRADWEKRYFFLLGWVQENYLHDYDKALAAYKRVYINYNQAFGYNDDAMMFSARILARTGKTAEAQKLYQELITSYPRDFWTEDAKDELGRLQSGEKPGLDWPGNVVK